VGNISVISVISGGSGSFQKIYISSCTGQASLIANESCGIPSDKTLLQNLFCYPKAFVLTEQHPERKHYRQAYRELKARARLNPAHK
jgi:hypothetical protein